MAQKDIEDIYFRLNGMAEDVTVLKTTVRLLLILVSAASSTLGAVALSVFVWWLNKH